MTRGPRAGTLRAPRSGGIVPASKGLEALPFTERARRAPGSRDPAAERP